MSNAESGWLIKNQAGEFWDGADWMEDATGAIRFVRQGDAERVIDGLSLSAGGSAEAVARTFQAAPAPASASWRAG